MREALIRARKLGCRVVMVKRTGEWRVKHPTDDARLVTCSNHRKDAPKHLLQLLREVTREREDAGQKARRAPLLKALKELPSPEYAKPGFIARPIIRPVVPVRTPEPENAKQKIAALHETFTATPTKEEPQMPNPKPLARKSRFIDWSKDLDAFIAEWTLAHGFRRGTGPQLYAVVQHSHPEWLKDSDGVVYPVATFSQHIAAVLRDHAATTIGRPEHRIIDVEKFRAEVRAEMEGAYRGTITKYDETLVERNKQLAHAAQIVRVGSDAMLAVTTWMSNGDHVALQKVLDIDKK